MYSEFSSTSWKPPVYDISKNPVLSLSSQLLPDVAPGNFVRMAKWCPDGSAALAHCENRSFQFLHSPPQSPQTSGRDDQMCRRILKFPSPILDFAWFPSASVGDPASFCFVASVRDCPVKLLDGTDGRLRASYKIIDHRERFVAPHTLAFNMTSDKLYCGFEDAIEIFDIHRPGEGTRLHTTPSKKSRDGLKGIISSLAFSSDAGSGIYAAGSLSPSSPSSSNIALFSEATGEVPMMFVGGSDYSNGSGGIRASVVQLAFNPLRPYLLYASFRRHAIIYEWDLRSDVHVPVRSFNKEASANSGLGQEREDNSSITNQKLRFDIDAGGQFLGVGDQHGNISLFDLAEADPSLDSSSADKLDPALQYKAHDDAVGSISFHPLYPIVLSVSGSRHFLDDDVGNRSDHADPAPASDSGSEMGDDIGRNEVEGGTYPPLRKTVTVKIKRGYSQTSAIDASYKYWSFGSGTHSNDPEIGGGSDHEA